MQVSSPAFASGGAIPVRYTCDGDDLSPPLEWTGEPQGTRSFLVVCDDPDAPHGTFHHWVAYDLPAIRHRLEEGEGGSAALPQARNSFGSARYGGPCPPYGHGTHHYHFRVAALSIDRLPVAGHRADYGAVVAAARPYVLAEAEVVGCFSRA